jgi:hypothetical protein
MVAKIRIKNSKAPLCGDPLFGHSIVEFHKYQIIYQPLFYVKACGFRIVKNGKDIFWLNS